MRSLLIYAGAALCAARDTAVSDDSGNWRKLDRTEMKIFAGLGLVGTVLAAIRAITGRQE